MALATDRWAAANPSPGRRHGQSVERQTTGCALLPGPPPGSTGDGSAERKAPVIACGSWGPQTQRAIHFVSPAALSMEEPCDPVIATAVRSQSRPYPTVTGLPRPRTHYRGRLASNSARRRKRLASTGGRYCGVAQHELHAPVAVGNEVRTHQEEGAKRLDRYPNRELLVLEELVLLFEFGPVD